MTSCGWCCTATGSWPRSTGSWVRTSRSARSAPGPASRLARATARGPPGKTYGEELPDPELGYRVFLPVDVDFDLDLHVAT